MHKIVIANNTCFNIDNEEELAHLQANDSNLKVLTTEQIKALGMEGYEAIVSSENTTVAPDSTIIFTAPALEDIKQERTKYILEAYNDAKYKGTLQSSLGFPVSISKDLESNLTYLMLQFSFAGKTTVPFVDKLGVSHDISSEQLKSLMNELEQYSALLNATKDAYIEAINSAKNVSEIFAVMPSFTTEFSTVN